MLKEFKEFIAKGNVMDMAVGIIMGAAFTAIVTSAVGDVIMPIVGIFTGGIDFGDKFFSLGDGEFATLAAAKDAGANVIAYGAFVNAVINFAIVAVVVFMLIKGVNKLKREEEAAPAEPPKPPKSEVLLEEIRDALKKK